mmetsp:Transcript_90698/g.194524  ORF Transcript_90698/g.194524 Transcript_90698/m.194524 type:complete len:381 (+) Transcript_90698:215-1357(+)
MPRLDSTWVLTPTAADQSAEQREQSQSHNPLCALVSLNANTASSAEVYWSELLAFNCSQEERLVLSVGRHAECNVQLEDPRVSLRHFEIVARPRLDGNGMTEEPVAYECLLLDGSSNGTSINGTVVGKGNCGRLRSGDEICVLPASRVGPEKTVSFVFRNTAECPAERPAEQENCAHEDEAPEANAMFLDELVLCPVCMQTAYKCVALMPCFHNFCSACYYDWAERKDDCPVCRRHVTSVVRNHPMDAVIEAFWTAHPERRRSEEEIREMDARDNLRLRAGGKCALASCVMPVFGITTAPVAAAAAAEGRRVQAANPVATPHRSWLRGNDTAVARTVVAATTAAASAPSGARTSASSSAAPPAAAASVRATSRSKACVVQ